MCPEGINEGRETFLGGITADYTCLDGRDFFVHPDSHFGRNDAHGAGAGVGAGAQTQVQNLSQNQNQGQEEKDLWAGLIGFWVLRDAILVELFLRPCANPADLPSGRRIEEQRELTREGNLVEVYTESGNGELVGVGHLTSYHEYYLPCRWVVASFGF